MLKNHIRTLLSANETKEKYTILVIGATHERYEQQLCKTGHTFYSYNNGKTWNQEYGEMPENYIPVDFIPTYVRPDLVLCHVSGERLEIANNIAQNYGVKVIRHTHTLPQTNDELRAFQMQQADYNTFISYYSRAHWGDPSGYVIEHGLDTDFWCEDLGLERNEDIFSVVNFWADRDWACGWKLYNEIKKEHAANYTVAGNNKNLSFPLSGVRLRKKYAASGIFLNTSQFSPVPMSLLEAMACGMPCVSSNTCMIPEIIKDGVNGILCSSPKQFAAALSNLKNDKELSKKLGDNARQTILDKYNIEIFTDNWNNMFRKAIVK